MFFGGSKLLWQIACWQGHESTVNTLKLVNWSTKKLESFKNQPPFSQLNEPVTQETSVEEVRADKDRSREQRSELVKSSSVLVVTDSLSDQTNLAPGQISLTSASSREKLDFVPPFHYT